MLKKSSMISVGLLLLGLVAASGCSSARVFKDVCSDELGQRYEEAYVAVKNASRFPAASVASNPAGSVSNEREFWKAWSEDRLVETQNSMDDVQTALPPTSDPRYPNLMSLRQELSSMANLLVQLHGYALQGRSRSVASTMDKIYRTRKRVRRLACQSQ